MFFGIRPIFRVAKRRLSIICWLRNHQAEGSEPIAKAVERIKTVERLVKQKIVVKESRGQWRPSLHDDDMVAH